MNRLRLKIAGTQCIWTTKGTALRSKIVDKLTTKEKYTKFIKRIFNIL